MNLLAVDPGPEFSAYVMLDSGVIVSKAKVPNLTLLGALGTVLLPDRMAIEMVASYGMPVGADIFETCFWIGRFWERAVQAGLDCEKVYRKDVKMFLCGTTKAKDSNITTAIVDRYDPHRRFGKHGKGTKKKPGPLFGFADDMWAALAVGLYATRDG